MSDRRIVPEFSEHHLVDAEGNVWTPFQGGKLTSEYVAMRMYRGSAGYLEVRARRGGKTWRVHRLVALAFIGPRVGRAEVNHKNGNKLDNRVENLEYVSRQENMAHAWRTGLIVPVKVPPELMPRGERRGHAKLTAERVREARIRNARGESQRELAKEYGVAQATLSKAITGLKWSHIQ